MPSLNLLQRVVVPSLRTYTIFSVAVLVGGLYYAYYQFTTSDEWQQSFVGKLDQVDISPATKDFVRNCTVCSLLHFMVSDQLTIYVLVNTACCILFLTGKLIQLFVFGRLRSSEQQLMRDRLWNFIFYKFVFVFGVLSVQYLDELLLWLLWLAVTGFLHLLACLSHDRFRHVTASPTNSWLVYSRILIMLGAISISCVVLLIVALVASHKIGLNYGLFLAAEAMGILLRSFHALVRYGMHLFNARHESTWEKGNWVNYYCELWFDMLMLTLEFVHYVHMLLWSNIFLSMASLVICMHLRNLYNEIMRKLKRHDKFRRLNRLVATNYPMVAAKDDDCCAICWDRISQAHRLPCGHCFHAWCLLSWLEQDSSCPTCRANLDVPTRTDAMQPVVAGAEPLVVNVRRRRTNHFFHFDGARYSRWLPSFSVEVSHNLGVPPRPRTRVPASQLNVMANQVHDMFPYIPLPRILEDIEQTNSVEATVDNILERRFGAAAAEQWPNLDEHQFSEEEDADEFDEHEEHRSESNPSTEAEEEIALESEEEPVILSEQRSSVAQSPVIASTSMSDTTDGAMVSTLLDDRTQISNTVYGRMPSASSPQPQNMSEVITRQPQTGLGVRFSKSAVERESILEERKRQLLEEHRRKYAAATLSGKAKQQ